MSLPASSPPTPTASRRSILGLIFGYWPWSREIVERGTDRWRVRTIYGAEVGDWRPQAADYVIYRITNRYTGSQTLDKVYLD